MLSQADTSRCADEIMQHQEGLTDKELSKGKKEKEKLFWTENMEAPETKQAERAHQTMLIC